MEKSFVTVRGNLTRDPEVLSDHNLLKFSVASNRLYYKNNEPIENTSYFDVTAWGKVAEWAGDTLVKGLPVIVYGRLEQQTWKNNEGENRSKVAIVAEAIGVDCMGIDEISRRCNDAISRRSNGGGQVQAKNKNTKQAKQGNPMDDYNVGASSGAPF